MSILLQVKPIYITEAENLADRLLNRAIITSNGLCWPSITAAFAKDRIIRQPNMTLASGNAGMCAFLCEAYQATGNVDFLEAAAKACQWIEWECGKGNEGARSLWFGQLGGVEALLALFKATQDYSLLDKAGKLAIKCGETYFTKDESLGPVFSSLGNGAAGALLTLLRVFQKTQEEEILALAAKLMRVLLWRVRLAPEGIYWDRMGDTIRPPIGFISGTSGVLYALAEANKVLPFEACPWLLGQGIQYQNSFLKDNVTNWPDLSYSTWTIEDLGNLDKKIRTALKREQDTFFTEFGDSVSWSHGCSGIALARSACSPILGGTSCKEDMERAVWRIEREISNLSPSSEEADFSLAGGLGGVGLVCLALYSNTGHTYYKSMAETIADAIRNQRQHLGFCRSNLKAIEDGEDMGFLTGSAGIGYFLLKLSEAQPKPSLLAPALLKGQLPEMDAPEDASIPQQLAIKRSLASAFPRTLRLLKSNYSDKLEATAKKLGGDCLLMEEFKGLCQTYQESELRTDERAVFEDTYRIEMAREELDFCPRGDRFLGLKLEYDASINRQTLDTLSEKKLLSKKLILVPEARVTESAYRWSRNDQHRLVYKNETTYCLHHQRPMGVFEAALPEFNYRALSSFRKRTKVKVALRDLLNQLSPKNEDERQKVIRTFLEQVMEAMRNGLLCNGRAWR